MLTTTEAADMQTYQVTLTQGNGYRRFSVVARNAASAANKAKRDARRHFGGEWTLLGVPVAR